MTKLTPSLLSYRQKNFSEHPSLTRADLAEENVSTLSLDGLDLLVHEIGSQRPPDSFQNLESRCNPNNKIEWRKAVDWASRAWKTIYIALTARNKSEFFVRHPLHDTPAREFITYYARQYCVGKAIKLLKFHTCYLFAAHTRNETPAVPFDLEGTKPGILAGGWVYKACHRLLRGKAGDLARAVDVLYSKYGMPKASEDFVNRTLEAHEKALTTPPKQDIPYTLLVRKTGKDGSEVHNLIPATRSADKSIKATIQLVCERVFQNQPFSWRHLVPKPSSCFERNTKNGGQITELIAEFAEVTLADDSFDWCVCLEPDPIDFSMIEVVPGDVKVFSISRYKVELVRRFEEYVCHVAEGRLNEWLEARQFGILEPLKCRVILMAQAVEMYLCTAIQRWMHGVLRKVPSFEFIGTPDCEEKIRSIFLRELAEGDEYVSGDYEGATDNIRGDLSSWAWSCVASAAGILNRNLVDLGHKCLTRHRIFPALSRKLLDKGKGQENGQSMGSPMSFPILCLVNAACWLSVYGAGEHPERQLWDRPMSVNGVEVFRPVRVNGDDIVFIGPSRLYSAWWAINVVAGLKPSIGKNYRSRSFLNIDSHTYLRRDGVWTAIKCVNTALVQDLVRKGINAGERTGIPWFSQKANFDYLVKGHSLRTQRNLKSMFLAHVRVPPEIATDLGVALGGPGFSVGPVSLKARCQTAVALCNAHTEMPLKVPRPEDDSWAGKICKGLLSSRTIRTEIQEHEDPLFDAHWRSESAMCSGDLLAALLSGFSPEGSLGVNCKNPLLNPTLDRLEGASGFNRPEFLRKAGWYEQKVVRWYSRQTARNFPCGRPASLFPSDVATTLRYSKSRACVVQRTVGLDFMARFPFGGDWRL